MKKISKNFVKKVALSSLGLFLITISIDIPAMAMNDAVDPCNVTRTPQSEAPAHVTEPVELNERGLGKGEYTRKLQQMRMIMGPN